MDIRVPENESPRRPEARPNLGAGPGAGREEPVTPAPATPARRTPLSTPLNQILGALTGLGRALTRGAKKATNQDFSKTYGNPSARNIIVDLDKLANAPPAAEAAGAEGGAASESEGSGRPAGQNREDGSDPE